MLSTAVVICEITPWYTALGEAYFHMSGEDNYRSPKKMPLLFYTQYDII